MTETTFSGPLKVGPAVGERSGDSRGDVVLARRVSVSADGAYVVSAMPACNIIEIIANVETAWAAATTAQSTIRVGNADPDFYGAVNVSAVGRYPVTPSAVNLLGVTADVNITVDVTTVGTAGLGTGSVWIKYVQTA